MCARCLRIFLSTFQLGDCECDGVGGGAGDAAPPFGGAVARWCGVHLKYGRLCHK